MGDCISAGCAKTAAAVFSQVPVAINNLLRVMNEQTPNAAYDGYASCPMFVGDKKLMLIEFKYDGVPAETFYEKQENANRIFYEMKKEVFPRVYFDMVSRGYWYGHDMIFKPKF